VKFGDTPLGRVKTPTNQGPRRDIKWLYASRVLTHDHTTLDETAGVHRGLNEVA